MVSIGIIATQQVVAKFVYKQAISFFGIPDYFPGIVFLCL